MCGIAGFYSPLDIFSKEALVKMTSAIAHRGPDAEGYFFLPGKIGLGHRRLSIIDLSKAANQPMLSACGNYIIIYNGEIYNYKEIAKELEINLKTTSDTEVIVEGYAKWGSKVVNKLNGMFGLAIYDQKKNELFVARDRMGIKPVFYYWDGKNFGFASEIKSLLALDFINERKTINHAALNDYLYLGYIPEPHTIYKHIYKFPSGSFLKLNESKLGIHPYWTLEENVKKDTVKDFAEAKTKLDELVTSSVKYRLMSDVPFGTFLSGGIDSSLVTAVAQKCNSAPINTFSIGFKESGFNESGYAKAVADYLGTNHHEFIVSYQDAIDLFDDMVDIYDEPYADSSCIPTLLVSKLARQHVKMTLSGDGGDETYMGYGFYNWAKRLNSPLVKAFRKPVGKVLSKMSSKYERASSLFLYENVKRIRSHIFSQEQYNFSEPEIRELLKPEFLVPIDINENFEILPRALSVAEDQSFFDLKYYLKDDLLVKVDRASMHYSLETRVPLLDHRLVEFSLNLDEKMKMKGGVSKYLLKQVLFDYVPEKYFERPKRGFSIPLKLWLKNELKHLIDDYLNEEVIREAGLVDHHRVTVLLRNYYKGKDYLYNRIWILIILHKWYVKNFSALK